MFDAYADAVLTTEVTFPSLAQVAAVLSSATYKSLSSQRPLDALSRLARVLPIASAAGAATVGDIFDAAYATLKRDYRNEYVFKNSVVSKIVFGRHKPSTASAILELPLGSSFADIAVFNGTSTVYEIKTDLDSFARLESQILDYSSRVEFVNVVVSDGRTANALRHVPGHVGLLALKRDGSIRTVREATSNLRNLRSDHIFRTLRRAEAERILSIHGLRVDAEGPADRWEQLRSHFASLSPEQAHQSSVDVLRARGMAAAGIAADPSLPRSTRALAYSSVLSKAAGQRLLSRLAQPIPPVWGP